MRLLNTKTTRLEEFSGNGNLPPYAILSHCWMQDEVSYNDIHSESRHTRHGFRKIEALCRLARMQGLNYAWIDTCCINRKSSAELAEAVNFMYAWYKQATVCYVYLEDVVEEAITEFSSSRWFTRGWTLLELLAPSEVSFYDSRWRALGDKKTLATPISLITGIGKKYVDGSTSIFEACVAERMSWAADRNTSRSEDRAYCLMGIFGLNMPLLYGEGRKKAFLRLQKEIVQNTSDRTIFAWTREPGQDVLSGLLAEAPKYFQHGVDDRALAIIPDCEFELVTDGIMFHPSSTERKGPITLPALLPNNPRLPLDHAAGIAADSHSAPVVHNARSPEAALDALLKISMAKGGSLVDTGQTNQVSHAPSSAQMDSPESPVRTSGRSMSATSNKAGTLNTSTNKDSGYGSMSASDKKASSPSSASDNCSITTDGRPIEMPENTKEYLASLLADDLSDNLDSVDRDNVASLRSSLPAFLRDFSMLMGLRSNSNVEKDATSFVRHRRQMISDFVERAVLYAPSRTDVPTSMERIQILMFREHEDQPVPSSEYYDRASEADAVAFADDTGGPLPVNVPEARLFLTNGIEYSWLLESIKRALCLDDTGNTDTTIRSMLLQVLHNAPTAGLSSLQLRVFWNPLHFFEYQEYPDGDFDFTRVIVVNGDDKRTHATSCGEYAELMWPKWGMEVLQCLGRACQSTSNVFELKVKKTTLTVIINGAWTSMDLNGEAVDVLEIAEVCTWVATVLRVIPGAKHKVVRAMPKLSNDDDTRSSAKVTFEYEFPEACDEFHGCWHQLFRQAIVARGYPVPHRRHNEKGMELSLALMSALAQAPWATTFGKTVLLRGIQSALVLVEVVDTSLMWHLLVNQGYLPYSRIVSQTTYAVQRNDVTLLETGRHFVGWTPAVDILTGSTRAYYNTARSDATDTAPGVFALSGITLSGGKGVNIGASFTRGRRDIPLVFENTKPYDILIKAAGKMRVILYGGRDRRAWFVDGASALLHLSRSWLSSEYAGDKIDGTLAALFQYPSTGNNLESNRSALARNRDLKLSIKSKEVKTKITTTRNADGIIEEVTQDETIVSWWTFEDLVLQIWRYIEKIHAHTELLKTSNPEPHAIHLKEALHGKLLFEGFEFSDILAGKDVVKPRSIFLQPGASEWLEFAHKVGTINLFAYSLGDLIVPSQPNGSCARSRNVPTGFDHLVTPFSVLKQTCQEFLKEHGDRCLQLAHAVYWVEPDHALDLCSCRGVFSACTSVVSNLSAKPVVHQGNASSILDRYQNGAIIIGHERRRLTKSTASTSSSAQPGNSANSDSGIDVNTLQSSSSSAVNLSSGRSFLQQQPLSRARRLLKTLHLGKGNGRGED